MAARIASDTLTPQSTKEAYRQATIECAALTSENVALKEAIEEKLKLQQLMERESQEFLNEIGSSFSLSTPMDDDSWCTLP
ncbi:hypothetical protein P3T76_005659 [Phytophthora citrophthora]|uniref:Uncharacterized protein n=1 Tax=Phytophthora citrophthora TaxID=4793 RepID=A0AAD9GQM5_9STRA|nr:hypothetical protein P3T76_005659 [Phytophthora citrophthora]